MSGLKGNTSTSTTTAPPAWVQGDYQGLLNAAQQQAAVPYAPYTGPMVAPFTPDQIAAFGGIENMQGMGMPYINAAASLTGGAAAPISGGDIANYYNPFTSMATGATLQNLQELNAQQNQQVVSNAIKAGAWGGDRAAIAQAELARQQAVGEAP